MSTVHNAHAKTARPGAVFIGRGSKWGNPFEIGKHGTRDQVLARFAAEVLPFLDLEPLRGRDLICYCAPARCHGDAILAALASSRPPDPAAPASGPRPRGHPCDICGAAEAPLGFQRPGGRAAQRPGTRPLWSCPAPACAAAARQRWLAAQDSAAPGALPRAPAPSAQKTLL